MSSPYIYSQPGCVAKIEAADGKVGNCVCSLSFAMSKSNPFKWRHYQPEIILLCFRAFLELSDLRQQASIAITIPQVNEQNIARRNNAKNPF
jgi:hypothetical protein